MTKEYTDDELTKSAMIAGLNLYGLPRPGNEEFVTKAKTYNIYLSQFNFKGGSGLILSFQGEHGKGILREPISRRIAEEIDAMGVSKEEYEESCGLFDSYEYIFKPFTDEGINTPITNLFHKSLRDKNGRLYVAGGFGITEYRFNITEDEAKAMPED